MLPEFHAMCIWSQCRVHWLVQYPIDSPADGLAYQLGTKLLKLFYYCHKIPFNMLVAKSIRLMACVDFIGILRTYML